MGDTGKKDKDKRRKQQIQKKEQKIQDRQVKQMRGTAFPVHRGNR